MRIPSPYRLTPGALLACARPLAAQQSPPDPAPRVVRGRAVDAVSGSRAAEEAGAIRARGYTVWELFAAHPLGRAAATLAVDNLFGARWDEAQFATTSRLRGERAAATELHFTARAPRSAKPGVDWRF